MYHLVKLEHLRASYARVCAAIKPATTPAHARAIITGKRREEDTWKVLKNITSVTFLYLDVAIWQKFREERVCD